MEQHSAQSAIDCGFTQENHWFRYRAGAIVIEDGCILMVGNPHEDFLYTVGGGVHMHERAEDAVRREVYEETGVHYEVDHLAVIHENFFVGDGGGMLDGLQCHEIALYYVMKPRGSKELHSNSYENGVKEEMHWIPIEQLNQYKSFPSFLSEFLKEEHTGIVHYVTEE